MSESGTDWLMIISYVVMLVAVIALWAQAEEGPTEHPDDHKGGDDDI